MGDSFAEPVAGSSAAAATSLGVSGIAVGMVSIAPEETYRLSVAGVVSIFCFEFVLESEARESVELLREDKDPDPF
jgi:hypothetical protein